MCKIDTEKCRIHGLECNYFRELFEISNLSHNIVSPYVLNKCLKQLGVKNYYKQNPKLLSLLITINIETKIKVLEDHILYIWNITINFDVDRHNELSIDSNSSNYIEYTTNISTEDIITMTANIYKYENNPILDFSDIIIPDVILNIDSITHIMKKIILF